MRPFKFLQDNKNEDIVVSEGASWIYGRLENLDQYQYNILTENHYGIHSFLSQFPSWFVVTIISITGPNGIEHNIDNDGTGWGFDITSDLIRVEWVRFIN
jgi:hypothetical protein